MRWLKRGLWLSAWGAWLWLGIGLYRELPRHLGPVVRRLPIASGRVLGFVGQSNFVAILEPITGPLGTTTIPLFDAETGTEVRGGPQLRFALTGPLIIGDPLTRSLRFGAIVGQRPMDVSSTTLRMLRPHRLDLLSGECDCRSDMGSPANLMQLEAGRMSVEPTDGSALLQDASPWLARICFLLWAVSRSLPRRWKTI
jgi:hypothetical protein